MGQTKRATLFIICAFCLGWLVSSAFTVALDGPIVSSESLQNPSNQVFSMFGLFQPSSPVSQMSPQDWIKEDQIKVFSDRVIIEIQDPEWASFTDTKSMEPVLDAHTHAIQVVPKSPDDIKVGDIVSYQSTLVDAIIIHRVIETGYDDLGWYAILKGDNLSRPDPEKVRFDNVRRILVAIIY